MTFVPALPIGGFAGWQFLNRTMEKQKAAFANSAQTRRDVDYFRDNIAKVKSADDLVSDRRLMRVALGAFGLESDLPNRFFIRKVLEEGTIEPRSLANRLADKRYAELSRAFGFDLGVPNTGLSDFGDRIVRAYETRQFEVAVGGVDETMRLALNLRRELAEFAGRDSSERAKWFGILGNPPLRQTFETAFGLPKGFGALDLDRQLDVMQRRSRAAFGDATVSQFSDPDRLDSLVQRFIVRAEIEKGAALSGPARGAAALQLLQGASAFAGARPGLFGR